jgi:hypothetical protein
MQSEKDTFHFLILEHGGAELESEFHCPVFSLPRIFTVPDFHCPLNPLSRLPRIRATTVRRLIVF